MVMDHQLKLAREHFGIQNPEDWGKIRAEHVLQVDGCGPQTVNHLRLYLANRGLTLCDDSSADFWNRHLPQPNLGGQISEADTGIIEPFTILIDSQEKKPFMFQGFKHGGRPLIIPTAWKSLGPSHGDYSISGLEGEAHVERKSLEDALGTFLSHGDRAERWLKTMSFLAEIPCAAIVVEATFGDCMKGIHSRGKRSDSHLRKEFMGQVAAWQQDYRVPFFFADHPRIAEAYTFKTLKRHWLHVNELKKKKKRKSLSEAIGEL